MSTTSSDSLDAVARVRRVRERDSLLGLHEATREAAREERRLEALEQLLDEVTHRSPTTTDDLVSARTQALGVGAALTAARASLASSRLMAISAREHWQVDQTRLKAIQMLQERRALEARAEADRAEARELDEIATQLWQRRRTEVSS